MTIGEIPVELVFRAMKIYVMCVLGVASLPLLWNLLVWLNNKYEEF